jgi:hypothetical protein
MVCFLSLLPIPSFYDDYFSALRTANRIFRVDSKTFSHAQQSETITKAVFYMILLADSQLVKS